MADVFIAIGSNLGDRKNNLSRAMFAMQRMGITLSAASSIYETEPWGPVKQSRYLNQVVRARTKLAPHALLRALRWIERSLGRDRSREQRFGPRTMDLDILIYDGTRRNTKALQLPHPRMLARAFVLIPLAEIAPGLVVKGVPIRSAIQRLDTSGVFRL
jgi:2-amino-4-hydroxy-6-hydroxymethyldihydropteridine diphosphokinase